MAYYPQYYPQQPYPYQPPMMDNLAQLRAGQYQQPVPPQTPQPMPQQSGQSMVWVSGQAEAMSYLVAPNSEMCIRDRTTGMFTMMLPAHQLPTWLFRCYIN